MGFSVALLLYTATSAGAYKPELKTVSASGVEDDFSMIQATSSAPWTKVPLIFDNDANYDDILSLLYLARHPLFDLKALTICATGMATPSQGPTNMRSILNFLNRSDVAVARGVPNSLSPIATMPLQWRVELDVWIEKMKRTPQASNPSEPLLSDPVGGISHLSAPQMMIKTIKKTWKLEKKKMVILATGPLTNLAVAMETDPSIVGMIQAVFVMGSAYGEDTPDGRNNVYSWQMDWNGAYGSCTEDGQLDEVGGNFLNVTALGYSETSQNGILGADPSFNPVRPGCRGQTDMTSTGNSEWNLFMDAVAWERVLGYLSEAPEIDFFALAVNATLDMPVTGETMEAQADEYLKGQPDLQEFVVSLAEAFTNAGEAKWWDAQIAVAMSEILAGTNTAKTPGVCASWVTGVQPAISTVWRSDAGTQLSLAEAKSNALEVTWQKRSAEAGTYTLFADKVALSAPALNPYGSVTDTPEALAPKSAFCVYGDVEKMVTTYWPAVAGTSFPSGTTSCKTYPKCMSWSKRPGTAP